MFALLFSPEERGLLTEAHAHVTRSLHHKSARPAPAWARDLVLYEIFVRAYSRQGTFAQVTAELPRLRELGVGAIWLMPIHPVGVRGRKGTYGSPYSVRDHLAVHPEFGSPEQFRKLVETAHDLEMRVLLDMVANHSANDHVEMARHPAWFRRTPDGRFTRRVPDWSDVTDFNYEHPELRRYMKDAFLYWVREFDVDGFRCDVAGMVPLDFWEELRATLDHVKSDLFLLAEADHPEMHLNAFDATYDWDLYYKMLEVQAGHAPAAELVEVACTLERLYPKNALRLRFAENHDLPRAVHRFGRDGFRPYVTLSFTLPGVPLLYNGQEIGARHLPSLFEQEPIAWEKPDAEVSAFYRKLVALRRQHPCLHGGDLLPVPSSRPKEVAAFARTLGEQTVLVVLNVAGTPADVELVPPPGLRGRKLTPLFGTAATDPVELASTNRFRLRAYETRVYGN